MRGELGVGEIRSLRRREKRRGRIDDDGEGKGKR